MKKILQDAYNEAKTLPKGLWFAAIVVPGVLTAITVYIAGKSVYQTFKKDKK